MSSRRRGRAHRVAVADQDLARAGRVDVGSAYAVSSAGVDRSAEDWARAMFEGGPAALRRPVVLGWRAVLRLRLGPLSSPDHVLGWRIVSDERDVVVLAAESGFLAARKVVRIEAGSVVVATFVEYRRRRARVIWPLVALVHRRTEPLLLTLAGRSA